MTDAQALADRVVAQGVGEKWRTTIHEPWGYFYPVMGLTTPAITADEFIRDGRVVLTLITEVRKRGMMPWINLMRDIRRIPLDADLEPAIVTATLEALETNSEG